MAIKINNTTVVDDSRAGKSIASLTFANATSTSTAITSKALGNIVRTAPTSMYTLNNPNAYSTGNNDSFARYLAISGNYAIVGAYNEDDAGGVDSGKAYIFNVTTGALLWTLNDPNAYSTSATDYFGSSVAISGNYAIVGASGEDDAGAYGTQSGKAYIYNVTTGNLVYTLNNPTAYSTSAGDQFGYSVAISGNYAIVGAVYEDDVGGTESGKAYIYNVTTGNLLWTLNNPNAYSTSANDYFGYSVAISNNYAIVGAWVEGDAGGAQSGKAYIFNVTTGNLLWTLNNPNAYSTSAGDRFGYSVAISGNCAIVGAYQEDDAAGVASGKAYIYNVITGTLLWTLNNPNAYSTSAGDNFGTSVAISGNYAIVGAYSEDDAGGTTSGKAYIFNVTTGTLLSTLNDPNAYSTSAGDQFGYSVAISGDYAVIGAIGEFEGGKAYIFAIDSVHDGSSIRKVTFTNGYELNLLSNKLFDQAHAGAEVTHILNDPNAYSTSAGDLFGISVAISGNYAIVGARDEGDAGGAQSGKAYIFNVTTGTLLWTLNNPTVYSTSAGDLFGYSVAISGNYAIVGAYGEDDAGGGQSGKAYIYNVTTGTLLWTLSNPNAYSTSDQDGFGYSVAISGNYAIVGTVNEDDAGSQIGAYPGASGKAYIYNVTTGNLLWTLNNPNAYSTSASDWFGYSIAISGNYAIVGAYKEDDAGGTLSGKAYIYNVTTGNLLWTLDNPNAYGVSAVDQFGISVAISGNYAIVGASNDNGSGTAYIYNVTTGALLWTLNNPNVYGTISNDNFGYAVAISGNYAIVGAKDEDDVGGTSSGKAYIYNVTTGALLWTLSNPNAYSTSATDGFGIVVAISGNYAIIGAYFEDDVGGLSSGKAYIFTARELTYMDKISTVVDSL